MKALVLTAGGAASTPPLAGWRSLTELTVELWCKVAAGTSLSILSIQGGEGFALSWVGNALVLTVNGTAATSASTVNDGAWHHIAATWRSASGNVAFFKDGVASGSVSGIAAGAVLHV
ncbi:concanavalin A-like lectin/glucanase domain-containing protein, partial [Baffinella frigidus]